VRRAASFVAPKRLVRLALVALTGGAALSACSSSTQTTALTGVPVAKGSSNRSTGSPGSQGAGARLTAGEPTQLVSAFTKTVARRSASFTMVMHQSGGPGGTKTFDFSGVADFATGASELSITLPLGGLAGGGSGTSGSLVFETKMLGGRIYMKWPSAVVSELAKANRSIKPWISLPMGPVHPPTGQGTVPAVGFNPTDFLSVLATEATSVKRVGQATVNGVATTEYTAVFSLAKLDQNIPADVRPEVESTEKEFGIATVPETIWVDGGGRVRQIESTTTLGTPSGPVTNSLQIDFSKFGQSVNVTAPPASSVTSITSIDQLGSTLGLQ
jgi:hypothetical protein